VGKEGMTYTEKRVNYRIIILSLGSLF